MRLSEELIKWRADRPDEWKMDELARKAKRLESALESLISTAQSCDNWESFPMAAIECAENALEASQ